MSNLMKMNRLVNGDDLFRMRVEAACWPHKLELTDDIMRLVVTDTEILDATVVDEFGTVDSSGVSDEDILNAVADIAATQ